LRGRARTAALLLAALWAAAGGPARAVTATAGPRALEVIGLRLEVDDLPQSIRFYTGGLGFELIDRGAAGALLRNGPILLSLRRSAASSPAAGGAVHANFEVADLKQVLEELGKLTVKVLEKRTRPIASGVSLTIQDPAGNRQQLLVFFPHDPATARPRLSSLEVEVPDVSRAREFYSGKLGLPAAAGAYPRAAAATGAAALMLSQRAATDAAAPRSALLLGTADLAASMAALARSGIEFPHGVEESAVGRYADFEDPFGNRLALVQPSRPWSAAAPVGAATAAAGVSYEPFALAGADGRRVEVELGRLPVPESRQRATAKTVELAFLRFKSTAAHPGAPIVYLAGGPGGSGIAAAKGSRLPLFLALRELADVIALDQRGTGMSRPELTCSAAWTMPLAHPTDPAELLARAQEQSAACARALRDDGIDLAAYNTNESADDIEDLRRALGAPQVSLLGISYGTNLALAAVRRHPAGLRSVILAGVEGPDQVLRLPSTVEAQLAAIGGLLQAEPGNGAAAADLPRALRQLLARLEAQPATVEVEVPLAHRKAQITVGKFDLQWMVIQTLASREGIHKLPGLLQAMQGGDFSTLGSFALAARRGWLGSAMPYAVQCAAGVSPERWRRIEREQATSLFGRAIDFPFPQICSAWGVPDLGPEFRAPVRSEVPALFISGTLDTRTPMSDADEVRRRFSRSAQVTIVGAGHGDDLILSSPEIGQVILRFLSGQAVADTRIPVAPAALQAGARAGSR